MLVLLFTKVVKVSVPFLYQFVLDTLGTGGTSASQWLAQGISALAPGGNFASTAGLIVLYTVTKIVAQFLQSANDVVFGCVWGGAGGACQSLSLCLSASLSAYRFDTETPELG